MTHMARNAEGVGLGGCTLGWRGFASNAMHPPNTPTLPTATTTPFARALPPAVGVRWCLNAVPALQRRVRRRSRQARPLRGARTQAYLATGDDGRPGLSPAGRQGHDRRRRPCKSGNTKTVVRAFCLNYVCPSIRAPEVGPPHVQMSKRNRLARHSQVAERHPFRPRRLRPSPRPATMPYA